MLRQAPWYIKHSNGCPFGSLPSAVDFQSFQSRSCILKCSYADYHHLQKVKIVLLERGIAKVWKWFSVFQADLNWETELNCHLSLFMAANLEKQGRVQNIFSHTASARERSPLDRPESIQDPTPGTRQKRGLSSFLLPLSALSKPNQEVSEAANTWCNLPRSAGLPGASLSPGIRSGALHLCSSAAGRAGTPQPAPRRTLWIHCKPS